MSNETIPVFEIPFQCPDSEKHVLRLYSLVFRKIKSAGIKSSDIRNSKALLSRAGFSQNGRNRLIHLSEEEVKVICAFCPYEKELWSYFVSEFQLLLSKMDQARKAELFLGRPPFMGRPYITTELAGAVSKLTRLRFLHYQGIATLKGSTIRELLGHYDVEKSITQYIDPHHLTCPL